MDVSGIIQLLKIPGTKFLLIIFSNLNTSQIYSRYSPLTGDIGNSVLSANAINGSGWCIFVYNLAPETEENVLWQLFGPFGEFIDLYTSFNQNFHLVSIKIKTP